MTLDNILAMGKSFMLVIVILVALLVWKESTTGELNSEVWNHNAQATNIKNNVDKAYGGMDFLFLMVYFGLHIGALTLAYFLRSHPIMLAAIFMVALIIAIISPTLSNAYMDIITTTDFTSVSADVPKMTIIMKHLPKFEVVWTFLTGIVLVGLARDG